MQVICIFMHNLLDSLVCFRYLKSFATQRRSFLHGKLLCFKRKTTILEEE